MQLMEPSWDLRPAGLEGDHAWIADFGLARMAAGDGDSPITSGPLVVGTPFYMSPEQARGGDTPVDSRSDVYSLSCVLYEMLSGEPPFSGPTREAILLRHALDPVPPMATVRPEVGLAGDGVLRTALAKSPAERFATAGQLLGALEMALRQ
jgi:eukaryotic-like serine/threonine-protein kinase